MQASKNDNPDPPVNPIRLAEFALAITRIEQAPPARPTVVFAGRSNVGKSSLLNRLVGQRRLARTSSTPGRTQEIIYFNIEGTAWFVDLPGYGYAKVPLQIARRWGPMVERFLQHAPDLRLVVLLVDARRDPAEKEFQLRDWLEEAGIPYIYAVTKIDKLTRSERPHKMKALQRALGLESDDALIPVSAETGEGVADLLAVIRSVLQAESPAADPPAGD